MGGQSVVRRNLKQRGSDSALPQISAPATVFGLSGRQRHHVDAALITGSTLKITQEIFGADTAFIKWDQVAMQALHPSRKFNALNLDDAIAIQENVAIRQVTTLADHIGTISTSFALTISHRRRFRGVQPNFGEVYANAETLVGRFLCEW
jgi:hypothetical protein